MPIPFLIMTLLLVALAATTWISRGLLAKSIFILICSLLVVQCLVGALHAWGEPPRSIPWTTGWSLGGLLAGVLAFLRYRRP
ncbi:hypothetical protein N9C81_00615 [Planctomycetota bacterium]|nr:hypothetical protein [Planctomycetota bacterium]